MAAPTARVPKVGADELLEMTEAYDNLRAAGLEVEIREGFEADIRDPAMSAAPEPRSGTMVPSGSVVSIVATGGPHLDLVRRDQPTAVVLPDLTGKSANAFFAWTDAHGADWILAASALPPSSRPHLWDNYRVARQSPKPGTRLDPNTDSGSLDPAVRVWLEPA
jgi:hypothetical protein